MWTDRSICSFFFFKQKTAYEILTCDWSSDVCSSDLFEDLTNISKVFEREICLTITKFSESDKIYFGTYKEFKRTHLASMEFLAMVRSKLQYLVIISCHYARKTLNASQTCDQRKVSNIKKGS